MEEDVVDDAEDDGGSADTEGKRQDCDQREAAVFAEGAEGVAEVSDDVVQVSFPAGVADFFFDAFEATEFLLGAAAGFVGSHAGGDVVGNLAFEMEMEFLIEFFLRARFSKEAANAAHHQDSSSALKTSPTASQRRSQLTTSASICLRPFPVSEWNLACRPVSDSFHSACNQPLSSKRWSPG